MFLDYLMKNKSKCRCRRIWVPLIAHVTKHVTVCETMLHKRRDKEFNNKVDRKIFELIKTRVEGNEYIQSESQWVESIKEAIETVKPADRRRVEELETVMMLGHNMSSVRFVGGDISWGGSNSYALLSSFPQAVSSSLNYDGQFMSSLPFPVNLIRMYES